jgi:hypothetical protein
VGGHVELGVLAEPADDLRPPVRRGELRGERDIEGVEDAAGGVVFFGADELVVDLFRLGLACARLRVRARATGAV